MILAFSRDLEALMAMGEEAATLDLAITSATPLLYAATQLPIETDADDEMIALVVQGKELAERLAAALGEVIPDVTVERYENWKEQQGWKEEPW